MPCFSIFIVTRIGALLSDLGNRRSQALENQEPASQGELLIVLHCFSVFIVMCIGALLSGLGNRRSQAPEIQESALQGELLIVLPCFFYFYSNVYWCTALWPW